MVCIRITSYENSTEAEFTRNLFVGRSEDIEITTFVFLAPDGKQTLCCASRGPDHNFRYAKSMAEAMDRICKHFEEREQANEERPELPLAPTVRLGINVASCDNQPFTLLYAKNWAERQKLKE